MASQGNSGGSNVQRTQETLRPTRSLLRTKWPHHVPKSQGSSPPLEAPPTEKQGISTAGPQGSNITLCGRSRDEYDSRASKASLSKPPSETLDVEVKNEPSVKSGTAQRQQRHIDLITPQRKCLPAKQGDTHNANSGANAVLGEDRNFIERKETGENGQARSNTERNKDGRHSDPKPCLVCVRVRPESLHEISAGGHLCVDTRHASSGAVTVSGYKDRQYTFHFDHVFDQDATQEAIYRSTCDCLLEKLLSGYSASVMAYGQTGAGKTYTMLGEVADYDFHRAVMDPTTRGVVPRMLEALFQRVLKETRDSEERGGDAPLQPTGGCSDEPENAKPGVTFSLRASLVEVYNDTVRDLLAPHRHNLSIRETACSGSRSINNGAVLTEATEVPVATAQEAFSLIYTGFAHRAHGTTLLNEQSSRSHAIFQLIIRRNSLTGCRVTCSRLCLVDLAGSERVSKADSSGDRLREAQSINKSLLALGNVISAVPQTQRGQKLHVPYRDSKLTRLLQHSFGGHTFTVLMLCCSPHTFNVKETLGTLRFGDRAANLRNHPLSVETVDPELLLLRLQEAQIEGRILQAQIRSYVVQSARQVDAIRMLQAYVPGEVTLSDDEKTLLKLALQEMPVLTHAQRLQLAPPSPLAAAAATNRRVASTNRPPKLSTPQAAAQGLAAQRKGASSPKTLEFSQGQRKLPQERGRADKIGDGASPRPKTAPFHPARPTTTVSQRGSPPLRQVLEQKRLQPTQHEYPEDGKSRFLDAKESDVENVLSLKASKSNSELTHALDATAAEEVAAQNNVVLEAAGDAEICKPAEELTLNEDGEKYKAKQNGVHADEHKPEVAAEGDLAQGKKADKEYNTTRISREKSTSRLSKFFSLSRSKSVNSKVKPQGQQGVYSK